MMVLFFILVCQWVSAAERYVPTRGELDEAQVEIIAGEEKTVYEYHVNGRILMIKIVPKIGFSYYLVPADGSAHFTSLDHNRKLYPQWVLFEW